MCRVGGWREGTTLTKIGTDYNISGQEENVHSALLDEMRAALSTTNNRQTEGTDMDTAGVTPINRQQFFKNQNIICVSL